jgi:hypothetical protein
MMEIKREMHPAYSRVEFAGNELEHPNKLGMTSIHEVLTIHAGSLPWFSY